MANNVMDPAWAAEIAVAWTDAYDACGAKQMPTQRGQDVILRALWREGLSVAEVKAALTDHVRESPYTPKVCDIVSRCLGTSDERADVTWHQVVRAIQRHGYTRSIVWQDSAIVYALDRMGGWQEVCQMTEKTLPFRAQDYKRYYKIAKAHKIGWSECPPYLLGWEEEQSRRTGWPLQEGVIVDGVTGKPVTQEAALAMQTPEQAQIYTLAGDALRTVDDAGYLALAGGE